MNGTQTVIITDPVTNWIMTSQWAEYFVFGQIVVMIIIAVFVLGGFIGTFRSMSRMRGRR